MYVMRKEEIHRYHSLYMYACVYACMYVCIHAYIHTCIHTKMHAYIHAHTHTHTHTQMHTWTQTRKGMYSILLSSRMIRSYRHRHTHSHKDQHERVYKGEWQCPQKISEFCDVGMIGSYTSVYEHRRMTFKEVLRIMHTACMARPFRSLKENARQNKRYVYMSEFRMCLSVPCVRVLLNYVCKAYTEAQKHYFKGHGSFVRFVYTSKLLVCVCMSKCVFQTQIYMLLKHTFRHAGTRAVCRVWKFPFPTTHHSHAQYREVERDLCP